MKLSKIVATLICGGTISVYAAQITDASYDYKQVKSYLQEVNKSLTKDEEDTKKEILALTEKLSVIDSNSRTTDGLVSTMNEIINSIKTKADKLTTIFDICVEEKQNSLNHYKINCDKHKEKYKISDPAKAEKMCSEEKASFEQAFKVCKNDVKRDISTLNKIRLDLNEIDEILYEISSKLSYDRVRVKTIKKRVSLLISSEKLSVNTLEKLKKFKEFLTLSKSEIKK